ncbi:hypothetical protein Ddc_13598 [Ditylenchus destructor]|nr:hypothetical protein Ddc_13598 [Ditylenchus destructor]
MTISVNGSAMQRKVSDKDFPPPKKKSLFCGCCKPTSGSDKKPFDDIEAAYVPNGHANLFLPTSELNVPSANNSSSSAYRPVRFPRSATTPIWTTSGVNSEPVIPKIVVKPASSCGSTQSIATTSAGAVGSTSPQMGSWPGLDPDSLSKASTCVDPPFETARTSRLEESTKYLSMPELLSKIRGEVGLADTPRQPESIEIKVNHTVSMSNVSNLTKPPKWDLGDTNSETARELSAENLAEMGHTHTANTSTSSYLPDRANHSKAMHLNGPTNSLPAMNSVAEHRFSHNNVLAKPTWRGCFGQGGRNESTERFTEPPDTDSLTELSPGSAMPIVVKCYAEYKPKVIEVSGSPIEPKVEESEENTGICSDACENCNRKVDHIYVEPNQFVGAENYDYWKFCEELYKVLYSSKEGYTKPSDILFDLKEKSGIDGMKVARENGYRIFSLLLKDKKMFGHVVAYERNPPGTKNFSFLYTATLSPQYDYLRRIVPRKNRTSRD